jgi:hypothetical protein
MKKTWDKIAGVILGVFIAFLLFCQISMMTSSSKNYGVPTLFGYSFLRVATDSMQGEKEDSLNQGTGIIIKKQAPSEVKVGDVITFLDLKTTSTVVPTRAVVTHRVMAITVNEDATRTFYCFGDNPTSTYWSNGQEASMTFTYPETANIVEEKYYIGTVVSHSDAFGGFLSVSLQPWFVPVMVLVPLSIIAILSGADMIKEGRAEAKEEEAAVATELAKAGIDPADEGAVLLFREKTRYKLELKKAMEKEKEKEKSRLRKQLAKEAKE